MMQMTPAEVARVTGAQLLVDGSRPCTALTIDSRTAGPDRAFVAIVGERTDGNSFAEAAVQAGAPFVTLTADAPAGLIDVAREADCALLRAADDDAEEFLLRLAAHVRAAHDWAVVAVTGSVGKTTTKDLTAAALAGSYRVHATVGNYNNLLGLPLTILAAPEDAQVLVLEMGMNHAGEIDRLAACAAPHLAAITNVGTAHIGLLGSREGIARAKAEIVPHVAADHGVSCVGPIEQRLFLVGEDDFTPFIADECAGALGLPVTRVGWSEVNDVRGSQLAFDDGGHPSFCVTLPDGRSQQLGLALTGRASATDALIALGIATRLGVDVGVAAQRLAEARVTRMRQEVHTRADGLRVIDDSYNASPESMAAALDVLFSLNCEGKRVAVLGEMGEQGDEAPRLHQLTGAYAAAKNPEILAIIGGELADQMAEGATTMGMDIGQIARYDTVDAALDALAPVLGSQDLVLVKASRSAGLDAFAKGVLDR